MPRQYIKKEQTPVIFRVGLDGEVFAIFPALTDSLYANTVTCYEMVGGHHEGCYSTCIQFSRFASPAEYADCYDTLVQLGYDNLVVVERRTPAMYQRCVDQAQRNRYPQEAVK